MRDIKFKYMGKTLKELVKMVKRGTMRNGVMVGRASKLGFRLGKCM